MLKEVERIRGHVIFEVSSTTKKTTRIIGFRLFPVKGIGNSNWGLDFSDLDQAKKSIPEFRVVDKIGQVNIYKTPTFYCYAPKGVGDDDLALAQRFHTLTEVKRAAALANSKIAA